MQHLRCPAARNTTFLRRFQQPLCAAAWAAAPCRPATGTPPPRLPRATSASPAGPLRALSPLPAGTSQPPLPSAAEAVLHLPAGTPAAVVRVAGARAQPVSGVQQLGQPATPLVPAFIQRMWEQQQAALPAKQPQSAAPAAALRAPGAAQRPPAKPAPARPAAAAKAAAGRGAEPCLEEGEITEEGNSSSSCSDSDDGASRRRQRQRASRRRRSRSPLRRVAGGAAAGKRWVGGCGRWSGVAAWSSCLHLMRR